MWPQGLKPQFGEEPQRTHSCLGGTTSGIECSVLGPWGDSMLHKVPLMRCQFHPGSGNLSTHLRVTWSSKTCPTKKPHPAFRSPGQGESARLPVPGCLTPEKVSENFKLGFEYRSPGPCGWRTSCVCMCVCVCVTDSLFCIGEIKYNM